MSYLLDWSPNPTLIPDTDMVFLKRTGKTEALYLCLVCGHPTICSMTNIPKNCGCKNKGNRLWK